MKKLYLVSAFVGMGLCVASTAFAFSGASLTSQTTEAMYDEIDPFDLSLDTALLYKIERWRLYTNASGYQDGNSYLLGTSGKLGPGSLSVFYETSTDKETYNEGSTSLHVTDTSAPFDGVFDVIDQRRTFSVRDLGRNATFDTDRDEYYASYGMDVIPGVLSLGLAINPTNLQSTNTDNNDPANVSSTSLVTYNPADHTSYTSTLFANSVVNHYKTDEDIMRVPVGVHWRPTSDFALRAYVSYLDDEYNEKTSQSGITSSTTSTIAAGVENSRSTSDQTSLSGTRYTQDSNGWDLTLVPTYQINPNLMVRCDLQYRDQDGDGHTYTHTSATDLQTQMTGAGAPIVRTVDTIDEQSGYSKGDSDDTYYRVSPRLYFTYGAAQFSLGVTYEKDDAEVDGHGGSGQASSLTRSYDPVTGALTGSVESISPTVGSTDYSNQYQAWSFPIGTLVKLTDKWTFRAGAAFVQVDNTIKSRDLTVATQTVTTTYDAAGAIVSQTGTGDQTTTTSGNSDSRTYDYTDYRLGLGYLMTENVNLDLMFAGTSGSVDTNTLYASITYAF